MLNAPLAVRPLTIGVFAPSEASKIFEGELLGRDSISSMAVNQRRAFLARVDHKTSVKSRAHSFQRFGSISLKSGL